MKKIALVICLVLYSSVCFAAELADMTIEQYIKMNTKKNTVMLKSFLSGVADGIFYANIFNATKNRNMFICTEKMTSTIRNGTKMLFDTALINNGKDWVKQNANFNVSSAVTVMYSEIFPPSCINTVEN